MGCIPILFLTFDAPRFSDATWEVVYPLKNVFTRFKGQGSLNNFFKSAEMLMN
jgi:hypothetical protein